MDEQYDFAIYQSQYYEVYKYEYGYILTSFRMNSIIKISFTENEYNVLVKSGSIIPIEVIDHEWEPLPLTDTLHIHIGDEIDERIDRDFEYMYIIKAISNQYGILVRNITLGQYERFTYNQLMNIIHSGSNII